MALDPHKQTAAAQVLAQLQTGGGSPGGAAPPALDLSRYFRLLLRHIWLILAIIIAGTALSFFYLSRQPKIYSSTATLQVEQDERPIIQFNAFQASSTASSEILNNAKEALTSTRILARAVRASGLADNPGFIRPRQDGQPFTDVELANRLRWVVFVHQIGNTSNLSVTVEDTDPETARLLAATLVEEFLKDAIEQRDSVANYERDFLLREVDRLEKQLETSEKQLQAYREENPGVSFVEDNNTTTERLADINKKVSDAKSARFKLESTLATLANLEEASPGDPLDISAFSGMTEVESVSNTLTEAGTSLAVIRQSYGPKHPTREQAEEKYAALQRTFVETLRQVRETLRQQYESARDNEARLGEALREQQQRALEQDRLAIRYNVLSREVRSDQALYDEVIDRLKESTINNGVRQLPYRIVEMPVASSVPVRPDAKRILAMGITLSVMLAVGLVLAFDFLFKTFRQPEEAETALGLDALAAIPTSAAGASTFVMRDDPASTLAEAFRNLRAKLFLRQTDESRHSFIVTSANPGEGKSFVSVNLATAFAQQGLRTVLLEADVRRPGVTQNFRDIPADSPGLTDHLDGLVPLDKIMLPTAIEHLTLIPAGTPSSHPAELLSKPALRETLDQLSADFDRIVIDTAPINAVSDTLLFSRQADAVILVIHVGKTSQQSVQRALNLLRRAENSIAGFVLNRTERPARNAYSTYYDVLQRR